MSKKYSPFIYWVAVPTHKYFDANANRQRVKFNLSLESVIRSKGNEHMRVMRLKDGWDSSDSSLVINNRFSESGLTVYWSAVDSSFKYNSLRREIYMAKNLSIYTRFREISREQRTFEVQIFRQDKWGFEKTSP